MKRAIELSMMDMPVAEVKHYKDVPILKESKIINFADTQKKGFLFENLLEPSELKLLFRASHHGWNSHAFHKACDDKEFTLTIYRTEFGKTVAGFTPFTWNNSKGWTVDDTSSSFLLSLDNFKRYELIEKERAIFCH